MTHEPLSISVKLSETAGLSVFTWISVPARTGPVPKKKKPPACAEGFVQSARRVLTG
jgi:hypothetical protein